MTPSRCVIVAMIGVITAKEFFHYRKCKGRMILLALLQNHQMQRILNLSRNSHRSIYNAEVTCSKSRSSIQRVLRKVVFTTTRSSIGKVNTKYSREMSEFCRIFGSIGCPGEEFLWGIYDTSANWSPKKNVS